MNDDKRKQLIDKANKKGLFDKGYDHLVLKESLEDRKELENKLKRTNRKDRPLDTTKTRKEKQIKKSQNPMERFFLGFINYFVKIKSSIKLMLIRKKTQKILVSLHADFYDYRIKKLKRSFPQAIHDNIYLTLREINILFKEIRGDSLHFDFSKKVFLLDLIYPLLTKETKELLNSINMPYFQKLLSYGTKDPNEVLLDKLLELKEAIIENDKDIILSYTSNIEHLFAISEFDFISLFRLFDPHYTTTSSHRFQPLFGDKDVLDIKALNSYLRIADKIFFTENTIVHFIDTINEIKQKVGIEDVNNANLDKDPDKKKELVFDQDIIPPLYNKIGLTKELILSLYNKLSFFNKNNILESTIRIMTNDYAYSAEKVNNKHGLFFDSYIKLIIEKQKYLFEKSQKNIQSSLMDKGILSLFNLGSKDQLMNLENYTTKISTKLIARGVGKYNYIEPVRIFKTFVQSKHKAFIEKIISSIIAEGDFLQKRDARLFSSNAILLKEVLTSLTNFELGFSNVSQNVKNITNYLGNTEHNTKTKIESDISKVDKEILDTLTRGTTYYKTILDIMAKIRGDTVNLKPLIITNAKSIRGTANKQFVTGLESSIYSINSFYKIMQSFPYNK